MTILPDDPRPGPDEPGILSFIETCSRFYPAQDEPISVDRQRQCYDNMCTHFHGGRPDGLGVYELGCAGPAGEILLRRYVPDRSKTSGCVVYMHGGGFVLGNLESHDDICCGIAHGAGIQVIAVDYRLAPEQPYPAAIDDCLAATDWIYDNSSNLDIDPARIVLAGDSAGGNLAAATCLSRRDNGSNTPAGQVLIYPAFGGDMTRGSYVSRADAPGLTISDIAEYEQLYLGPQADSHRQTKLFAPLLETRFEGLPPAFLVACEWDPLRDDSFEYFERLREAGVPAELRHEPELVHASLRARYTSPAASAMFAAIVDAIVRMAA